MSTTTASVDRAQVVRDFEAAMKGKLDQEKLDAAIRQMRAADTSYTAEAIETSVIFYMKWLVKITTSEGRNFNGNAGGFSTAGGGGSWGDVFTDDLARLYDKTDSFSFFTGPGYVTVQFWDKHSNFLGHFEGGAFSTAVGAGGGTGHW